MNVFSSKLSSDNRKSAIQNPKWVGILAIVLTLVFGGAAATAQHPGKIARIGFLDPSTTSAMAGLLEAFRQELSKLGWIEGKNITIEYRFAEQKSERLPELAVELVRLKVDLIVTSGGSTPMGMVLVAPFAELKLEEIETEPDARQMSTRILILFCLLITVFLITGRVEAQQSTKVPRIGYLSAQGPARASAPSEVIRLALHELGYVEGQNIAIEYRYGEVKRDRAPELAAELVRLKVDIIVVSGGGSWVRAVKNATKTIPIVMIGAGPDPVKGGLIDSLARPGGNVTGVTNLNPDLGGKRLELFKEAVPKLARVAVLYDPTNQASVIELKEILPLAARALGVTVRSWEIRAADGFEKVFAALSKQHPDGLYVSGGPLVNANGRQIAGLAFKSRLPSMYIRREFVDAGGLMSYGADTADGYRLLAWYVDKILKGAKPADLPV